MKRKLALAAGFAFTALAALDLTSSVAHLYWQSVPTSRSWFGKLFEHIGLEEASQELSLIPVVIGAGIVAGALSLGVVAAFRFVARQTGRGTSSAGSGDRRGQTGQAPNRREANVSLGRQSRKNPRKLALTLSTDTILVIGLAIVALGVVSYKLWWWEADRIEARLWTDPEAARRNEPKASSNVIISGYDHSGWGTLIPSSTGD